MSEGEVPTPANVGGQAVIEGVMMRAPGSVAIVVRRRNGSIVIRERSMPAVTKGPRTWPLARGMLTLFSSLRLGSRSLRWSVEILEADLIEEDRREQVALAKAEKAARVAKAGKGASVEKKAQAAAPSVLMLSALAIARVATLTGEESPEPPEEEEEVAAAQKAEANASLALPPRPEKKQGSGLLGMIPILFAVGLFIALPQAAAELVNKVFKLGLDVTSPGYQVITGISKLVIIVSYLSLIRLSSDIKRVFQYHGAEHKAISTYERGLDLVVEKAKPLTTLHARCGTTFLIMVAFVSVVVFSIAGAFLPTIPGPRIVQSVSFFLLKLPLLPFIAGITYEIQRVLAKYCSTGPLRVLLWPGFLVQKITTAEPDPMQLEIALASLRAALAHAKTKLPEDYEDKTFASYERLVDDPSFGADAA